MSNGVEPPSQRVAVLLKGERVGVIGLQIGTGGTILSSREDESHHQSMCQTPAKGRELFFRSINTSCEQNGFRVGFLGSPNNANLS